MTTTIDLDIRPYRDGDEHAILATFNEVFAPVGPPSIPRSLAFWNWQYKQNPAGHRIYVAQVPDGRIVAQFAGIPLRIWKEGRTQLFSQVVDSFAHEDFRRGKPSPFIRTALTWCDVFGGDAPDQLLVNFGPPAPAAWKVGSTWLRYEMVREIDLLVRELDESPPLPTCGALEVETCRRVDDAIEPLWARFRESSPATTLRDPAYLNWRFADKPGFTYEFLLARDVTDGAVRGLAVHGPGSFSGYEGQLLVDWMVPPDDEDAGQALFAELDRQARTRNRERIVALLQPHDVWFQTFQARAFHLRSTQYFMALRRSVESCTLDWLRRHWTYTLGDLDLV